MNEVKRQKLRQEVGECFIEWADAFFLNPENRNTPIRRKMLHDSFKEFAPREMRFNTAQRFKQQMRAYCKFRGYVFNPGLKDERFNSNRHLGVEYFTIGTTTFNIDEQYARLIYSAPRIYSLMCSLKNRVDGTVIPLGEDRVMKNAIDLIKYIEDKEVKSKNK